MHKFWQNVLASLAGRCDANGKQPRRIVWSPTPKRTCGSCTHARIADTQQHQLIHTRPEPTFSVLVHPQPSVQRRQNHSIGSQSFRLVCKQHLTLRYAVWASADERLSRLAGLQHRGGSTSAVQLDFLNTGNQLAAIPSHDGSAHHIGAHLVGCRGETEAP